MHSPNRWEMACNHISGNYVTLPAPTVQYHKFHSPGKHAQTSIMSSMFEVLYGLEDLQILMTSLIALLCGFQKKLFALRY